VKSTWVSSTGAAKAGTTLRRRQVKRPFALEKRLGPFWRVFGATRRPFGGHAIRTRKPLDDASVIKLMPEISGVIALGFTSIDWEIRY
jgi:hypothetical protein